MADPIDKLLSTLASEETPRDPVERLLSTLETERSAPAQPAVSSGQHPPARRAPAVEPPPRGADSIERLLHEVSGAASSPSESAPALERMLKELGAESASPKPVLPQESVSHSAVVERALRPPTAGRAPSVERSLREVSAELVRERAEAEQRALQEQAKQRQAEQQARARLEQERRERASAWLAKLDRYSNEGMWFHEFAYRYPSLLDAALDYLDAVRGPVDKPR